MRTLRAKYGRVEFSMLGVMRTRTINSVADVEALEMAICHSADTALAGIANLQCQKGLQALWKLKFSKAGCDPLSAETPLNFIEQLNQTFTYLATARAVKILLELHEDILPLTVNLGTTPGFDIQSGTRLLAEVFAAVTPHNNNKLKDDVNKLAAETTAEFRYAFFMCPTFPQGRQKQLERVDGVKVWSVGDTV